MKLNLNPLIAAGVMASTAATDAVYGCRRASHALFALGLFSEQPSGAIRRERFP